MKLSRRSALQLGLMGGSSLFLPSGQMNWAIAAPCPPSPLNPAINPIPLSPQVNLFERSFKLPELLEPKASNGQFDRYEIRMEKKSIEIFPGYTTEVWSYIGVLPNGETKPGIVGPIIRQQRKKESIVRFINNLGEDRFNLPICTSIHLHGMPSLPQYDGYAEDLIEPGQYKDYYYPNSLGGVNWYHDHALDKTSRNVYHGLAGMYLVDYDDDDFVNPRDRNHLPQGDYDVPLIIQDKRFDQDRQLVFADRKQTNLFGDVILVNGVPWPRMTVTRSMYRFRALNAGTSRTLQLSLDNGDDLIVLASDAGLLRHPVRTKDLLIGVAERYEFVIDFSKYREGTQIILRNGALNNIDSDNRALSIMRFDVIKGESESHPIPDPLGKHDIAIADLIALKGLDLSRLPQRTFRFERSSTQWLINNRAWHPRYVAANPTHGGFEIWNLVNPGGGWVHPVHIHLVKLKLLSRSSGVIPPYQLGWNDTFYVSAFETVRVLAQFGPHRGKYMMHCHNLVHEDHHMMTQFEVGQGGCDPLSAPALDLPATPESTPNLC